MKEILSTNGFTLFKGPSRINGKNIVAILTLQSENIKTGNMAQLWILTEELNPLAALKSGKDEAICGDCIFRQSKGGDCYVFVGKEPYVIWKAWKDGSYPILKYSFYQILSQFFIRFGAYGDPSALPLGILQELKKNCKGYTSYTHQWKADSALDMKSVCMASVDNAEEYNEAVQAGWRTYRVLKDKDALLPGEILCPNITNGVQCKDCLLCCGTSLKAKNIAIPAHGRNRNKFNVSVVSE
jgi:hypothetical protein